MEPALMKRLLKYMIFILILFSLCLFYEWLDRDFLRGMEKAWSIYNDTLHAVYINDYKSVKHIFKNKKSFDIFREKLLSAKDYTTKIEVSECFYIDICFAQNDCTGFAICPISSAPLSCRYGKSEFQISITTSYE